MTGNGYAIAGRTAAAAALLALAACSSGADSDGDGKISQEEAVAEAKSLKLEPGNWESKVEIVDVNFDKAKLPPEARGMTEALMKAMVGKVTTSKNCLTPEEAANPDAGFLTGGEKKDCEYKRFDLSGGKIDAAMICKGDQQGQQGEFTLSGDYSPTSYTMAMVMNISSPGTGTMVIKAKNASRRIGACEG